MTLGSLFDGSGGFPLAGSLNGIKPVWASEIEPYPIAVTHYRFPDMKHLGGVMDIDGRKVEPVDIITFGSPCQDMSIAGNRAGMQHTAKGDDETTRSGLFFEAVRIIKEMRDATDGKYPLYAVWENVPGAFSSNKGEDFRCVLEELAQVAEVGVSIPQPGGGKWKSAGEIVGDHYSIAWRTLDAQYWGVPQRRKRIYLVADFTDGRAGEILFERESMSGNIDPCEAEGQGTADDVNGCVGGSNCFGDAGTWYWENGIQILRPEKQNRYANSSGMIDKIYDARGNGYAICVGNGQLHQTDMGDRTGSINCMHDQQIVLHNASPPRKYIVRRLTPLECCRLQGFPDGWGDIPSKESMNEEEQKFWHNVRAAFAASKGKSYTPCSPGSLLNWYNKLHSDSSEYKMWGNGIALPCAYSVLYGIAAVNETNAELERELGYKLDIVDDEEQFT